MGLKWMEWMGIWGGIRQRRGWKEGKGFGEYLEYVGRYGITTVKGGRFAKSGKSWIVQGGNGFLERFTNNKGRPKRSDLFNNKTSETYQAKSG